MNRTPSTVCVASWPPIGISVSVILRQLGDTDVVETYIADLAPLAVAAVNLVENNTHVDQTVPVVLHADILVTHSRDSGVVVDKDGERRSVSMHAQDVKVSQVMSRIVSQQVSPPIAVPLPQGPLSITQR